MHRILQTLFFYFAEPLPTLSYQTLLLSCSLFLSCFALSCFRGASKEDGVRWRSIFKKEEDEMLRQIIQEHGANDWDARMSTSIVFDEYVL